MPRKAPPPEQGKTEGRTAWHVLLAHLPVRALRARPRPPIRGRARARGRARGRSSSALPVRALRARPRPRIRGRARARPRILKQLRSRPVDRECMADFERLDVYRCALDFTRLSAALLPPLAHHKELAEQFRRAAPSIPLNIAEGSGRRGKDRQYHYSVARGSAMECAALLDVAMAMGILPVAEVHQGKTLLDRVIGMLSVMTGVRKGTGTGTATATGTGTATATRTGTETESADGERGRGSGT